LCQRRADSACADLERIGYRRVIKVGVVAEKQRKTLSFREFADQRVHISRQLIIRSNTRCRRLIERRSCAACASSDQVAAAVHDDPPQPRLKASFPAILISPINGEREGILYRIAPALPAPRDRRRDPTEVRQPAPIDHFDLRKLRSDRRFPHLEHMTA
jgi:hypothetical protein